MNLKIQVDFNPAQVQAYRLTLLRKTELIILQGAFDKNVLSHFEKENKPRMNQHGIAATIFFHHKENKKKFKSFNGKPEATA